MSKYPIHEDLRARAAERLVVQQIIDTLKDKGLTICTFDPKAFCGDGEYRPIYETDDRLVALLMDVDYKAYIAEKDAMYDELVGGPR